MVTEFASAITSFAIASLIIPVIIKYALSKNLLDIPDRRKVHKRVTPSMGGIAIFIGFIISVLVWIPDWHQAKFLLAPFTIIFFMGVRDDVIAVRAETKLIGQLMAAGILVIFFDFRLTSLYGLWNAEFPLWLSYVVTIATIIIITNSFNLIDGLDGLASTLSISGLLAFGTWFYLTDQPIFSLISFAMIGAVLAFLIFNWEPSEIFMGDTGAMVIGLLLSVLAIQFINSNYELSSVSSYKFNGSVATSICFIMVQLIDTTRITLIRLIKKQSPFKADKSHIHHTLLRLGLSHKYVALTLGVVQLLFIGLALALNGLSDMLLLLIAISIAIILTLIMDRTIKNRVA
jgi:UDP-GlcNAc:undecaprenyl-phosphate/decaprenyl-phosphate GlcNAc-1-phosphate transferase